MVKEVSGVTFMKYIPGIFPFTLPGHFLLYAYSL